MVIKSLATWILSSSEEHYHSSRPKPEQGKKKKQQKATKEKRYKIANFTLPFYSPDSFITCLERKKKKSTEQDVNIPFIPPVSTQGSNFSRSLCFLFRDEKNHEKNP